jgi:hypothetical protein
MTSLSTLSSARLSPSRTRVRPRRSQHPHASRSHRAVLTRILSSDALALPHGSLSRLEREERAVLFEATADRSPVAPGALSGAYVASWSGAEQPSENDVSRIESTSAVNFPRFVLSARFPGRLTMRARRSLPARLPYYPPSGLMSFAWDPSGDGSLMVHVLLGSNPVLSCFVPAAPGRFDVPREALDLFRGARPTSGRVSLARVNHVQVGNRLIRYQLEESAYNFGFE